MVVVFVCVVVVVAVVVVVSRLPLVEGEGVEEGATTPVVHLLVSILTIIIRLYRKASSFYSM